LYCKESKYFDSDFFSKINLFDIAAYGKIINY